MHALEEDAAHTAIERDYQQLVLKLIQEKAQLAEHMQKKQTDMMDYYAIWAHQIKDTDCGCGFVVTGDGRKSAGSGGTGY